MEYNVHIRDIRQSDPYILADPVTGKYYTYARYFQPGKRTGGLFNQKNGVFYALVSEDLIHWSEPVEVFKQGNFWADLDYWAPECHIWKDK